MENRKSDLKLPISENLSFIQLNPFITGEKVSIVEVYQKYFFVVKYYKGNHDVEKFGCVPINVITNVSRAEK